MRFGSLILLSVTSLLLSACVDMARLKTVQAKAKQITLVSVPLSVTEAPSYQELGPVQCDVNSTWFQDDPDKKCRDDLRFSAVDMFNADLVVVETTEHYHCPDKDSKWNPDGCVRMHGRAYRKISAAQSK